jgi:hypothetical protein
MDDFTIDSAVDVDVVQILEMMQSSRPLPISQLSPGDNVESGIVSINPSDAILSDEFPCPDDSFNAPEDQIRCIPSLNQDVVETFNPFLTEIHLNVQIMSRILEDQQVLRFNCPGDFFTQIIISGPSVPVETLLRRVLQTCCPKFLSVPDKQLPFRIKRSFRKFFIRNPDITLLIPRDLSRLSSIPYSSTITISDDQWGN